MYELDCESHWEREWECKYERRCKYEFVCDSDGKHRCNKASISIDTSGTVIDKARYTLFANNSKIGVKRQKNDVRRIVYKRRLPCFVNRFFAARCTQNLCWGSSLVDEHEVFLLRKKSPAARKLTVNDKQCTATRSSCFYQQYFIRRKNNFVPYSSCLRIVYSGLKYRYFRDSCR